VVARKLIRSNEPQEFDAAGFARTIAAARHREGMSTRELARRANISQAYVVALERARVPGNEPGPTPTVDVIARLAGALGMVPRRLFETTLRPVARHVLFVVDRPKGGAFQSVIDSVIDSVIELTGASVDTWLTTFETQSRPTHSIRLHSKLKRSYNPTQIEGTLRAEMKRLSTVVEGQRIGVVFDEMSTVMGALADPHRVIEEESRWADQVSRAVNSVGAHALWNVCVYEFAALQALRDPVSAAFELATSHDMVWDLHDGRLTVQSSIEPIVQRLRG
jgi:transcriptional regulator with XRE-family HTH domain